MSADHSPSPKATAQLTAGRSVDARAAAVEVRRSARRRRTVSAYREGDRTIVLIPARMSAAEEKRWVTLMLDKLAAQESKRVLGDDALVDRAHRLSRQYLGGKAVPDTVRWVTNQNTRWGSCTPAEASIRLSHRLQGMPEYVVDYVLLHELAHLIVPGHGQDFWELLAAYPRTERARGYLEGVVAAGRLPHLPQPPSSGEAAHTDGPPDSRPPVGAGPGVDGGGPARADAVGPPDGALTDVPAGSGQIDTPPDTVSPPDGVPADVCAAD